MKNIFTTFVFIFGLPLAAFAGKQTTSSISKVQYTVQGDRVMVRGEVRGTQVSKLLRRVLILGQIGNVSCKGLNNPCDGAIIVRDSKVLLSIGIDRDQDGNYENILRNIEVASVENGHVNWKLSVLSKYIEDTYSFLEKLAGARDSSWISTELYINM